MAKTDVEMVNAALAYLGEPEITSLAESTTRAQLANRLYASAYSGALSSYRWTFARTVTSSALARLVAKTADDYYQYQLPAGRLAVVRVFEGDNGEAIPYRVEGDTLVTLQDIDDTTGVYVTYVVSLSEGSLPGYFIDAFEHELAARLAMPITHDPTLAGYWGEEAKDKWRKAKYIDASSTGARSLLDATSIPAVSGR